MSAKDSSKDIFNDLSHHAYLLIGDAELRDEVISILEKKHAIPAQGNPDFFIRNFEILTIDDARELKMLASTRPIGSISPVHLGKNVKKVDEFQRVEKKVFVLTMNGITVEAQNAMLKLLEEPPEYAHFFLIIPSVHVLLPTVKSRMLQVQTSITGSRTTNESKAEQIEDAEKFIKMPLVKRLDYVKTIVDEISKEKKTKQDAIEFLNAVQEIVYKEKGIKEGKVALEAIEKARDYLNDRAPSVKMLLEYVALNV